MAFKVAYNSCFGGFSLSDRAMRWLEGRGAEDMGERPSCRHHPLLIECIEALGVEAEGSCASLSIREIPGTQYKIDEYDGSEQVVCPEDGDHWRSVSRKEMEDLRMTANAVVKSRKTSQQKEIERISGEIEKLQKDLAIAMRCTHDSSCRCYACWR